MNKIFMCVLLLSFTAFIACKKSKSPAPENQERIEPRDSTVTPQKPVDTVIIPPSPSSKKTSIKGAVLPLFALKHITIRVTNKGTAKDTLVLPDEQGRYQLYDLPAGNYDISFIIGDGGKPAVTWPLVLSGTETKDMGSIDFTYSQDIPLVTGTGKITGVISPATVNNTISATHELHRQTYTTTVDSKGQFTFDKLPAGSYYGSVNAGSSYTPVTTRGFTVTLAEGQTLDAGEIKFYDNNDPTSPYFISFELDGIKKLRQAKVGATYETPNLRLNTFNVGTMRDMLDRNVSAEYDRLDIILDEVNGPGIYPLKGTAASTIKYSTRTQGYNGLSRTLNVWSVGTTGGQGTVQITSIDPITRTMSGTFSATLVPASTYAKDNKVITNGSFANFKY